MRRKTRNTKIANGAEKNVKEKFIPSPSDIILSPKLEVKNNNQKTMLRYLREGRQIIFAHGSAGCGKSYIAAFHACTQLKQKKIDKIVLVRANVSVGKSLGMLPGTLDEKLLPFFQQTLSHLREFLGNGFVSYCLEHKTIEMLSIEHMRGMSLRDVVVIIEEAQNLSTEEFEMILTRIGENTQLIFTGDEKQRDVKKSGLSTTITILSNALREQPSYLSDEDLFQLESNIGVVNFTPNDVVRSGICKSLVTLYYYQGEFNEKRS